MTDTSFLGYSFQKAFHYAGESHKCSDGRSQIFSTTEKGRSESTVVMKKMDG